MFASTGRSSAHAGTDHHTSAATAKPATRPKPIKPTRFNSSSTRLNIRVLRDRDGGRVDLDDAADHSQIISDEMPPLSNDGSVERSYGLCDPYLGLSLVCRSPRGDPQEVLSPHGRRDACSRSRECWNR
jgi:hypothetical protein